MLLYDIAVRAYGAAIRIAAIRHRKARQWVRGRSNWTRRLRQSVDAWGSAPRIWVHCASYGEFEQGKPVMEALRKRYPGHRILLTFFSPSGYEPLHNWEGVDAVAYLPLDTRANANRFLDIVKPDLALFIKYEFWLNFLKAIRRRNIRCYLVSAVFKPHHPFFKWYGAIFRDSLRTFSRLFIQDEGSGFLLKNIEVHNFEVCGDTRFDRVIQISEQSIDLPEIGAFKGTSRLIIAGSTWPGDEELVIAAFKLLDRDDVKLLIAPHDIEEKSVNACLQRLRDADLPFAVYTEKRGKEARIMVLNTMGMLSRSYHYADVAYIGGGFDGGLHNSLEAAVFGVPVTFYGKDYTRFNEAVDLLALGAAVNVRNAQELADAWSGFLTQERRSSAQQVLRRYFEKNRDSTSRILSYLEV